VPEVIELAKKIKFGVVGVGVPKKRPGWKARLHYFAPSIAWARYFPQIDRNPRAELTAACDVVGERLEDVKKVYKVRKVFTDYREMLEKADIDAVVITTPHKYHFPMALDAIREGKHLIVEKPLGVNSQEAKEIAEKAGKEKVKLMPGPWLFDDCFFKIKQMIDRNLIGKICLLRSKMGHFGPGHGEWFFKSGFGAGVTFDLAIYPVTTLTALVGPAKRVAAFMGTSIERRLVMEKEIEVEVEDNVVLNLDFGDSTFGDIAANYCTQVQYGPSLEVYGSRGALFVENGYLKFSASQDDVSGLLTSESPIATPFPDEPVIDHFVRYVLEDVDIRFLAEQQIHVIEILEKAIQSSSKAETLELTSTFDVEAFATCFARFDL